jgi:transketolase
MRRTFTNIMDEILAKDPNAMLLTLDVGFGVLEPLQKKYPKQFLNVGLREQHAVSLATGLALKGKTPFLYSISSFMVFKALEQIRMLSNMEQHVVLVGTGLDDEYTNFGITHYTFGDEKILSTMPITVLTPKTREEVTKLIQQAYNGKGPYYIRLSRFGQYTPKQQTI